MFDHVVFGTSDYEASKAFYLKALAPIGLAIVSEGPLGVELSAAGIKQPSLLARMGTTSRWCVTKRNPDLVM